MKQKCLKVNKPKNEIEPNDQSLKLLFGFFVGVICRKESGVADADVLFFFSVICVLR